MSPSSTTPLLTVIIPVHNEEGSIAQLLSEARDVWADKSVEVVIVDDGSGDKTGEITRNFAKSTENFRVISHPQRSGKSAALRTGMRAARTLWVATMDGDGQDDPRDVLNMATRVDLSTVGAVGLVGGVREQRADAGDRKAASRLANGLRRWALKDDCPDTACGLKLVPRDLFLAMPFFDALHRYLPAFTRHFGFDAEYVVVNNRPRQSGVSKYSNFGRAVAGLFDLTGVVWLMRRTSVPDPKLLVASGEFTESAADEKR